MVYFQTIFHTITDHRPGVIWVEFAVGSCLTLRVFLRILQFSSLYKNRHSKFQFDQDRGPTWKSAKADVMSSLYNNVYLIL